MQRRQQQMDVCSDVCAYLRCQHLRAHPHAAGHLPGEFFASSLALYGTDLAWLLYDSRGHDFAMKYSLRAKGSSHLLIPICRTDGCVLGSPLLKRRDLCVSFRTALAPP